MKTNKKIRLAIMLSTFVALLFIASTPVSADGAYDLGTVLPKASREVHEPVNAGIEDLISQTVMALTALSGVATTSFLIKKTK